MDPHKRPKLTAESKPKESENLTLTFSTLEKNRKVVFGELLRRILNGLKSTILLKSVRLVSKTWRDEATRILRRRHDSFRTVFKFDAGKNSFILFKSKVQSQNQNGADLKAVKEDAIKSVSKLTEMLNSTPAHNSNFPTAHFHFEGGSLDCPQVLEFFSFYGKNIHKLTVDVRKNPPTIHGALRQKIFHLAPNLECLELMDSDARKQWTVDLNDPEVNVNQGQGQGQIAGQVQLESLKELKFSKTIDYFRIQSLLKLMRPTLPQTCSVVLSQLEISSYHFNVDPEMGLEPKIFNRDTVQVDLGTIDLFHRNLDVVHLERLARCRLRFRRISSPSGVWNVARISPVDVVTRGKLFFEIMEGSRETLEYVLFSVEPLVMLCRQPVFPGFFQNIKSITVSLSYSRVGQNPGRGPDHFGSQAQAVLNKDLFCPLNNPNPLMWKNLSEVMPSLRFILLALVDGDCEPWLPFLDSDAGQHHSVKHLMVPKLYTRQLVRNVPHNFPSLENLDILTNLISPPSAEDSVEQFIHWLFLFSTDADAGHFHGNRLDKITDPGNKVESDKSKIESKIRQENTPAPQLFAAMKFLKIVNFEVESCSGGATSSKSTCGSSHKPSSVSNPCSLSKITGANWYAINRERDLWREILDPALDLKAAIGSTAAQNPAITDFSTFLCIKIYCVKHEEQTKI